MGLQCVLTDGLLKRFPRLSLLLEPALPSFSDRYTCSSGSSLTLSPTVGLSLTAKSFAFAQQKPRVAPFKLHLGFQCYSSGQWDTVAETRAGRWRRQKKEWENLSSNQINAMISTSDKSCFGSSLLRARKASPASSPQLCLQARWKAERWRGGMPDWCHSHEWEQANYSVFPIPQEPASSLWQSGASAIAPLLTSQDTSHR